jgi:hypothetical protein
MLSRSGVALRNTVPSYRAKVRQGLQSKIFASIGGGVQNDYSAAHGPNARIWFAMGANQPAATPHDPVKPTTSQESQVFGGRNRGAI